MKSTISIILVLFVSLSVCYAAKDKEHPKLPETAIELIETLKKTEGSYTTWEVKLDYVTEKDLPRLVELLDSEEPCAYSVMSISSQLPAGRSNVGNEAAYLIESFWKRYYPTRLTSSESGIPKKEELKMWYRMWANLKNLAEQKDALDKK